MASPARIRRRLTASARREQLLEVATDIAVAHGFHAVSVEAVARDAVRQSIVILKNDRSLLPLARSSARIFVAGKSADNMGNQCGGWTVSALTIGLDMASFCKPHLARIAWYFPLAIISSKATSIACRRPASVLRTAQPW